jgi:hypothetical protein
MHTAPPRYPLPGEQKAAKLPLTTNKFPLSNTHQLRSNNPAITQYLHTGVVPKSYQRGTEFVNAK